YSMTPRDRVERAEDTIDSGHATGPTPSLFTSRLKEALRRRGRELGLDAVGFASADELPRGDYVERWLASGRAGAMHYLARGRPGQRRALLLEGARTIVVGAARYQRPRHEPSHVAAYAQRGDYHPGLRKALRPLAAELRAAVPGSATRICIDAAPILEREAAARAGVGWIGKNTLIVHPELGCYTLLGLILWTGE